ncbi:MAG: putative toxin-antitoxin system toxin component, PIN family [Steroidobacteraceae bacterium]|nr:putative toxin-antitoxin system toxin component, PIN family [Steroidobacteraceae bacterium]
MIREPVVIDTNVVVAGLLTADAASPVARILDGMLAAAFPFVLSEALLDEYRAVLVRPALRKQHGLTVTEVETLLVEIARHAIVLVPGRWPPAPDPGDQFLWDLLAARPDLRLVTGDQALLGHAPMRSRVLSPRAFVDG